jgi:hypothetical protein
MGFSAQILEHPTVIEIYVADLLKLLVVLSTKAHRLVVTVGPRSDGEAFEIHDVLGECTSFVREDIGYLS